jgi:1,4-dihydroxy-2-naphthoate octaprenyltransferase
MDDDKGSIGGIKNPTKVSKAMFPVTIVMDIIALLLTIINFGFLVLFLLSLYILASRAYSYRGIRLKQYPIVGYFTVAIFQGPVIYALVRLALNKDIVWNQETVISSIISFLLIGAGYPISQIYQHKQDKEDGVYTLSMLLGIRGTFIFSGILFFIQASLLTYYFSLIKGDVQSLIIFFICLLPVLFQFNIWMLKSFKDESYANYENTMKTNILGAVAMNIFFIYLTLRTIL